MVVIIFLSDVIVVILFWSSGIMDCMMFRFENSTHAVGGIISVAYFITIDEQPQYNQDCYISP